MNDPEHVCWQWTKELSKVREAVQVATRRSFNSVLLNHYRDGFVPPLRSYNGPEPARGAGSGG